jgi:hypothetical protein
MLTVGSLRCADCGKRGTGGGSGASAWAHMPATNIDITQTIVKTITFFISNSSDMQRRGWNRFVKKSLPIVPVLCEHTHSEHLRGPNRT